MTLPLPPLLAFTELGPCAEPPPCRLLRPSGPPGWAALGCDALCGCCRRGWVAFGSWLVPCGRCGGTGLRRPVAHRTEARACA